MHTVTKRHAFTLHLIASAAVITVFLGVMFAAWYPQPYFDTDGGWKVLRILAGVDLVLGPLLTLIVFQPGKPSLKFDMGCIVALQLAALFYGGMLIYQQRPAFVVFGIDRFTTVPAAEVEFDKLKDPELKRSFGIGPLLAQIKPPEDPKLRQELMFAVIMEGQKDLDFRAEFYEAYQPDLVQLSVRSINLNKIAALDEDAKHAIDNFLADRDANLEDFFFLPLRGKNKNVVMVLSKKDGMPTGSININPWLEDYRSAQ